MTVWFAPQPLPDDKMPDVADIPGVDRRLTVLHFLDDDPARAGRRGSPRNGERIARRRHRHDAVRPRRSCPCVHGTDLYVDELRDDAG